MDRVRWRAKQSLDFTFLMMCAKERGTYYVQLEDDVISKNGFISTMKTFAAEKTAADKSWLVLTQSKRENGKIGFVKIFRFIIDFCALGFIGKMFKTVDLPFISQFLLMFYKNKPGAKQSPFLDWAKK